MNESKWFLVINPAAGNGKGKRRWPKIQKMLHKTGIDYDFAISEYPEHPSLLAKGAVEKGYRNIVAVGGDGTLHEVVNGLMEQEAVLSQELTLAIIPLGTGNDWIKTHKIPKKYKKAVLLLNSGKRITHDVGKIHYHNSEGEQKQRYFINVAGLAYDAFVTKATKVRPKWWGNNWLYYQYLIFVNLFRYQPTPVKVIYDEGEMEHSFFNITVGNCIYNGGGTKLVPHADPDDGLFALTLLKDISPWEVIFKSYRMFNGTMIKHPQAFYTQSKHIRIEAADATPAFIEADGECLGQTPIEFRMLDKALNVIVP